MGELPQPDVMDRSGRMRRLVLSLIVGASVAAIAYAVMYAVIPASEREKEFIYFSRNMSAGGFMVYFTAVAGALAFIGTLAITTRLAKKKWQRERIPPAKQVS